MIRYLLDTDHISLLQRHNLAVHRRLRRLDQSQIFVSVVTIEEQVKGWLKEINDASAKGSSDRLCFAYRGLGSAVTDLNLFQHANFDSTAYECFRDLRRQGIRIGTQDLRIAAIVIMGDFVLVSRNRKDFGQVPNLKLERWDE